MLNLNEQFPKKCLLKMLLWKLWEVNLFIQIAERSSNLLGNEKYVEFEIIWGMFI
jgi:hypothetical protein